MFMNRKQNDSVTTSGKSNEDANDRPSPIFAAVALALGVAVAVLTILEKVDSRSALIMPGIAVFGLGLNQLAIVAGMTKK